MVTPPPPRLLRPAPPRPCPARPRPARPSAPAPVSAPGSAAGCGSVPPPPHHEEEGEPAGPLSEVFTTVLLPCCCSQCRSECRGYKGLLLSHAGSLKSKSYLAVSKATTCGIIKKVEVLVCQIEGILAWREHFIFICLEESNVFLPAKLRDRCRKLLQERWFTNFFKTWDYTKERYILDATEKVQNNMVERELHLHTGACGILHVLPDTTIPQRVQSSSAGSCFTLGLRCAG
ncbi:uncharacterized protein LOC142029704 isoform X4 [Buteo buteo]